ncbi:hypothetical protein [Helicobacter sp. L8]|uniref:hypothetical protein n=1 Tax=Helicobacter sp. L8 TaxID=2316078 RepID=UPI000EAF3F42|nr:hypothetical protein [Helicobacter sp. L8]
MNDLGVFGGRSAIGGSGVLGGIGAGIEGVNTLLGIASLGAGIWSTQEQLKHSKEAMRLAREQFMEENRRYNAREKERLEANAQIGASAQNYDLANPPNSAVMERS